MSKNSNPAPKSLSLRQIVTRAIIVVAILLVFAAFTFLLTDVYFQTSSEDSAELLAPKNQEPVGSQSKSAEAEEAAEDVNLTFYERLTKENTYSSKGTPSRAKDSKPKPPPAPVHETKTEASPAAPSTNSQEQEKQNDIVYYAVQVGSFQSLESAQRLLKELKKKGFSPSITPVHFPEGATWYRVRVGNSLPRSKAEEVAQNLRRKGDYQPLVVSVK